MTCFGKLFEKIIHSQLYNFFEVNEILNKHQSGFRKKFSVDTSITNLLKNIIHGIDRNNFGLCVFLDLKKAFDLVDHEILLSKLSFYGIRGIANDLFRSYLLNRVSYVSLDNFESECVETNLGVPQGSILGPFLFLIYINDIVNSSTRLKFNLFADDTSLYFTHENLHSLYNIVNVELDFVYNWILANKLCLNFDKTVYLLFSGRKIIDSIPDLRMGNNLIIKKNYTKFLGVFLDDKLCWNFQIDHISNKL